MKRSALGLSRASFGDDFSEQAPEDPSRSYGTVTDSDTSSGTRWRVVRAAEPRRAADAAGEAEAAIRLAEPVRAAEPGALTASALEPGRGNVADGGRVGPEGLGLERFGETAYERSKRKRLVKARTLSTRRLEHQDEDKYADFAELSEPRTRPTTRAECARGVRPCPYVSCRYHLYLEVSPRTGSLKLNFPDLEVWELTESCSLDVAERGAQSTELLGELLNLTPERARQLEQNALRSVATGLDRR